PLHRRYGVIQIDPVAMVEELGDEAAFAAAKALRPRTYLVYLSETMGLPWPGRPWYGFMASIIGPSLRVEEPAKAITSDMCVPIAPNAVHPHGRLSVVTQPLFPFSNCYHWVESNAHLRI
ncbi:hypothetical protein BD413DRAFT_445367, partial [Trametes elegans]